MHATDVLSRWLGCHTVVRHLVRERKPVVTVRSADNVLAYFVDPSCLVHFSGGLTSWLALANDSTVCPG